MATAEDQLKQPAKIKYELALHDYTQADVARECGIAPTTVGAVVHGRSRSRKVELRIAAITQKPLAELWPQWHGPDAHRRRRKPTTTSRAAETLRAVLG